MSLLSQGQSRRDSFQLLTWWNAACLLAGGTIGILSALLERQAVLVNAAILCVVLILVFWAMTGVRKVPERFLLWYFFAFIAIFVLWPSYISIRLPGLPWISVTRVALVGLALVWLYCIFNSPAMQNRVRESVQASRVWLVLLVGYVLTQFLSLTFPLDYALAANKTFLYQFLWTLPLFMTVSLLDRDRHVQIFSVLFVGLALAEIAIAGLEVYKQRIVWFDMLPPGFAADSEYLTRIIEAKFRAETYRAQGTFVINLVYSEFLVLALPFSLYLLLETRRLWSRLLGLVTAIASVPGIYVANARSGMVGIFVVALGYGALYAARRYKAKLGAYGPLLLSVYLIGVMLMTGAFMASGRLQTLTIGGGQHQASTNARFVQWEMGIPKIAARPLFGYGMGNSGDALGFTNLAGVVTVDTYVLTTILEVGVVGLVCLFGLFAWAMLHGARLYVYGQSPTSAAAAAAAASLMAFCVIKLVLSQVDNHALIFVLVGFMVALVRMEHVYLKEAGSTPAAAPERPGQFDILTRRKKLVQLNET